LLSNPLHEDYAMTLYRSLVLFATGSTIMLAVACGSDETQATETHTPASYTVLVDSVVVSPPFMFTQGQTVTVQLKFLNAANEDPDAVEDEHFGGLTFDPTSLATVARVPGHNYRFLVTGGTPGSGTVQVSFGHDSLADETTFPPVAATTVQPAL
jgi:hypothetical protein